MASSSRARAAIVMALVAVAITACSLIVDTNTDQCTKDADCTAITNGAAAICQVGVCVSSLSADGSNGGDAPTTDSPSSSGEAGCTPKTATQDDFLNDTCTTAQCIPFDNCARVGVCDAGTALPNLIAPPDGGF